MRLPMLSFVYDRKKVGNSRHAATVELRVNYDGRSKYMSTGVRLFPKEWHSGMVTNRPDAMELNKVLANMQREVISVMNDMMNEGMMSIMEIPSRLERLHNSGMSLWDFCEQRIEVRRYGRVKDTGERYDRFMRFFKKWGRIKTFADITDRNVLLMDEELKKKGLADSSKWNNYHRILNSFIIDAISAGLMKRNPYQWVHINKDKGSKGLHKYLTPEELARIERVKMPSESLNRVRDLFVFQTYTCLSYKDMAAFDFAKCTDYGGHKVYTGRRGKTGQEFTFVLLTSAMRILERYGGTLPVICNVKYNQYLKVVAQMAGIDKPISSHWARHTGATILLNEGVDMETVAKILGHSSTRITRQVYAKLLDDTVARKMLEAESRMAK